MINFEFKHNDWEALAIQIVLIIVSFTINAWIINVCWNEYLIHAISGLREIDMYQALAIRILASSVVTGITFERNEK
jgi:hypothetical protein